MILKYYDDFLDGVFVFDICFCDFENYVIYVDDDNWGGVMEFVLEWYEIIIEVVC